MRRRIVWLVSCLLLGCSGSRPGAFIEGQSGAPDRTSCLVDDDCVAAPLFSPDLCCDTGVSGEVVSRAFDEWRRATQAHRCEGVECPPASSPALPRPCAVEPRCVANQCTHSCEEIARVVAAPEPPSIDRSEVDSESGSSEALRARVVVARSEADGRWLRIEVVASGLRGCEVASAAVSCPPDAEVRALASRAWRELDERWTNVRDRNVCRVRIDDAGWTPIRIFSTPETIDARTPEGPESLHPPECFRPQHLVSWITREWRARPPAAR